MTHDDSDEIYPELAKLVVTIAGGTKRVGGKIQLRTGLDRVTASRLLNGVKVKPITLERFARGYGVPTNPLRVAMGLEALPIDPTLNGEDISINQFEISLPNGKSVVVAGILFDRDEQDILTRLIRHFAAESQGET